MFMEKIEAPRVTCDLFGVEKGFYGCGSGSSITGDKPRAATETEARAYADFIRRKCGLPDLGKPNMHTATIGGGRGQRGHFHYVGATFGQVLSGGGWEGEAGNRHYVPAQYEPGAFSVLFPGANMMQATVTLETLDDAGEVVSSQTMPVEPKKGGLVWSKDDVRKACGPVAKAKAARKAPTVAKRRAAPTVDKRRRAVLLALRLRKQLRISRDIAFERLQQLAENSRQNAAKRAARPDAPAPAPDAILGDLAAAEAMMRGEGYVAPRPLSMREAFGALYCIARRDKLAGADLLHAACDLTGEPHETFKCPRACRLHTAVTRALEDPEGMRYRLQRNVLNAWGARHGLRSPAMDSPRFEAWRRVSARADALRKRLADAGRLEYDAGNWVCAVLPLPVTPEPAPTVDEAGATPTAIQASKRTSAHERAIRHAWAERKAAREYRASFLMHRDARNAADDAAKGLAYDLDRAKAAHDRMEAEALRVSDICRERDAQLAAAKDQARLAEHEAREALAAREDLQRLLRDAEARLAAAEAENAQLWAEIETLTAPAAALAG